MSIDIVTTDELTGLIYLSFYFSCDSLDGGGGGVPQSGKAFDQHKMNQIVSFEG